MPVDQRTGAIFARFRDDLLETHHSKELQNRVYAYRSLFSNVLDGEDGLMQRGHVFHVAISPAGRSVALVPNLDRLSLRPTPFVRAMGVRLWSLR